MALDGFRYDEHHNEAGRRRIRFIYKGVEVLRSTADPEQGLQGPFGFGDLGYDEIELLPGGLLEHRLLFSTGIELQVRFADLELEWEDLPQTAD